MKKILMVLMSFILASPMVGCGGVSDYASNMKARENIALYENKYNSSALKTITDVIKEIIRPFDEQKEAVIEDTIADIKASLNSDYQETFKRIPTNDSQYALSWMGTAIMRMSDNASAIAIVTAKEHGRAEMARARSEAIKYLEPIVKAIYDKHTEEFGTPPTAIQLGMALVQQVPFVATVGGMYGLGVAGIDAATAKLTGTFNGSPVNTAKGGVGGATQGGKVNANVGGDASVTDDMLSDNLTGLGGMNLDGSQSKPVTNITETITDNSQTTITQP